MSGAIRHIERGKRGQGRMPLSFFSSDGQYATHLDM